MAKIDAIDVPKLTWPEAAAPSTPASGKVVTYAKSDGLMYSKDDAGVEVLMSSGAASGIPATIFDAKGDLIGASAADTAVRIPAPAANNDSLGALSSATSGLAFLRHRFCFKTADESFSSTTPADSTSMLFAIEASKSYSFRFIVYFNTNAATVALMLSVSGPASCAGTMGLYEPNSAAGGQTIVHLVAGRSTDLSTPLVLGALTAGPGTGPTMAIIEGFITNSTNAGNIQLRHASETNTATTIMRDSHGELWEVA